MKQTLPFVCVIWEDAWGDPTVVLTTVDAHLKNKPSVYRTYGFVASDNEKGVLLTNEECVDDESFRGGNFINRSLIRSITRYNISKVRERKPRTPGGSRSSNPDPTPAAD